MPAFPPTDRRWSRLSPWGGAALLTLAVAVLYGHTLGVPWYFDDHQALLGNPVVRNLGRALAELWRPRGVALFTFAANYRFAGAAVAAYHLTNIAIHLGCALLVWRLLRRSFSEPWALLGGLLFLAHPLQTQAVTYVVQRMTSLAALCFLLALELFLSFRAAAASAAPAARRRAALCYGAALLAGALAVFTKENAAVLPPALLLYVRCFDPDRRWRPLLLAVAPFLLAPLLLAASLAWPLLGGGELARLTGVAPAAASPLHYLVTQFSVLCIYLRLIVLPYGQTLDYGYPLVTSLWSLQNLAALAALLLLGWGGWRLRRRLPGVAFGVGWFFLTLAVESSLIPLDPLFEHRLYLPLFGAVVALLALAQAIPQRRLALAGLLAALLVCGGLTWQRNALWRDPLAFSADNVAKAPHSERAFFNLAARTLNSGDVNGGLALLQQSLERFPASYPAYAELADYYRRSGRLDDAIAVLRRALAHCANRATIYNNLGFFYALQQQPQLALDALAEARAADPALAESYFNTARLLVTLGRLAEAESFFRDGFARSQASATAYIDFGILLERQGRQAEAQQAFRAARRLEPDHPRAAGGG